MTPAERGTAGSHPSGSSLGGGAGAQAARVNGHLVPNCLEVSEGDAGYVIANACDSEIVALLDRHGATVSVIDRVWGQCTYRIGGVVAKP